MAENNSMQEFLNSLGALTTGVNATVYELNDAIQKIKKQSKDIPLALREFAENVSDADIDAVKKLKASDEKLDKLRQQLDDYIKTYKNATDDEKKVIRERIKELKQQQREETEYNLAIQNDKDKEIDIRKEIAKELEEAKNKEKEEREKASEEAEKERKQQADKLGNALSAILSIFTSKFTTAVNNVVSSYEVSAGKLSAALDLTVDDISEMQKDIAADLRANNLNQAISNVAILNEMSSLADSGYTGANLTENATALARAKEVAPGLNLDTSTIKNLTNVFGSDFIDRFSAIQTAVQSTAGSTVGLREGLNKLMTDLEPVYLNAQYSANALQASADVEATLTAARDQYNLSESDVNNLRNSLVELMDPTKAFNSNNTAVRMAALQQGQQIWETGDVSLALQAIMGSQSNLLSNINGSSNMNAMLYAGALGNWNTMSYGYNRPNIGNFLNSPILRTEDLGEVADQDTEALKNGDYTTQSEAEQFFTENMELTQQVSQIAEKYPLIYNNVGKIVGLLESIGSAILSGNLFNFASSAVSNGINSINNGTIGATINKVAGTKLGTVASVAGGVLGGYNIYQEGKRYNEENNVEGLTLGTAINAVGANGNILSAVTNGAMVGGAIGTIIPIPGVSTVAGAVVGGAVGGISAIIANLTKSMEDNTEATKEDTEATTKNSQSLSQTVDSIDILNSTKDLFEHGSGLVQLADGTTREIITKMPGYASGLDYVPYDDYAVRLHKGEAVVTAQAAEELRRKNPNFWNDSYKDNSDVVDALKEQTDSIVSAVRGDKEFSPLTQATPKQYTIKNQQR